MDGWYATLGLAGMIPDPDSPIPPPSLSCGQLVFLPVVNDDVFMLSKGRMHHSTNGYLLLALSLLFAMLWPSHLFLYNVKAVEPEMFCRTWTKSFPYKHTDLNTTMFSNETLRGIVSTRLN